MLLTVVVVIVKSVFLSSATPPACSPPDATYSLLLVLSRPKLARVGPAFWVVFRHRLPAFAITSNSLRELSMLLRNVWAFRPSTTMTCTSLLLSLHDDTRK